MLNRQKGFDLSTQLKLPIPNHLISTQLKLPISNSFDKYPIKNAKLTDSNWFSKGSKSISTKHIILTCSLYTLLHYKHDSWPLETKEVWLSHKSWIQCEPILNWMGKVQNKSRILIFQNGWWNSAQVARLHSIIYPWISSCCTYWHYYLALFLHVCKSTFNT